MDSNISNTAFQEALQRARQLAAKISHPTGKRPNEDDDDPDSDFVPTHKKPMFESQISEIRNQSLASSANLGNSNQMKPQKGQLYLDGIVYNGEKTLDIMIPGNKVGFVIGKGGEMIRTLQDKASVKMVFNQESTQPSDHEKQLRITGPPEKVDYAKQLVNDLLIEKDMEMSSSGGGGGGPGGRLQHPNQQRNNFSRTNSANSAAGNPPGAPLSEYGSSRITFYEYPVSPQLIGLVIGKGGETIRKIQADSGCKVQFDTSKLDAQGNKICQFTGTQEAVNKAVEMVKEIIDTITGGSHGSVEEVRLIVPTSRTGTVIGRGGETIRALKQQSCCNIELDKNFHSTENDEKCFIIRGAADKVAYAQQLVTDKVAGHVTVLSSTLQSSYGHSSDAAAQYGAAAAGYMYSNHAAAAAAAAAAQGQTSAAAHYYWQQQQQQQQQSGDANSKATQDQYAAWAAYYAQYYSQNGNAATGASAEALQQQQQYAAAAATSAAAAAASAGAGGATSSGSENDESVYQQWIDYYKAYGMINEAEQMEQKLKEYKASKQTVKKKENDDKRSSQNGNDCEN